MLLTVFAYLGGVLVLLTLCLLPMLHFRAPRRAQLSFRKALPILIGAVVMVAIAVNLIVTDGHDQKLPDCPSATDEWICANAPSKSHHRAAGGVIGLAHRISPDAIIKVTDRSTGTYGPLLPVEGVLPPLSGAVSWLNSPPLTRQDLHGKVVVINIWTYSCINCLRSLPYLKAWADKYRSQGLVVIGVHAPEFAFERDVDNVKRATHELGVDYPVAIDNNYAIWRGLGNEYWPAQYFVDARGQIRHHNFGEGNYAKSEKVIQILLAEAGNSNTAGKKVLNSASVIPGVEMAADVANLQSPETYIGYAQADDFASPGGERADETSTYVAPAQPAVNDWGLAGKWNVGKDYATLVAASGSIVYRFHARDLHLVMGPGADGKPVRFRVRIDGAAPGDAHGTDVADDGSGTVTEQRLYQLVRQKHDVVDHTFSIEFLDPGVEAYAFTFG